MPEPVISAPEPPPPSTAGTTAAATGPLLLAFLLVAPGLGLEAPAAAQDPGPVIRGEVVEAIWANPLAGADVVVLDEGLEERGRAVSDVRGRFLLHLPGPGTYTLQARFDRFSSAPLDLEAGSEAAGEVVLRIPSAPVLSVLECLDAEGAAETGVVLGLAREARTGIALPGARVEVRREDGEGPAAGERTAVSGEGGHFVVCGVPAGVALTVEAGLLGRRTMSQEGVVVEPGAVLRTDLEVDLEATERTAELVAVTTESSAGAGVVEGTLVDAGTEQPVSGALVRMALSGTVRSTGPDGGFAFDGLEEGLQVVEVEHLAYGVQRAAVEVPEGAGVRVELRVEPQALELEGVEVTARRRSAGETPASRPFATRGLAGERLAVLEHQGASVMAAVRRIGAGLTVRDEHRSGRTACIEANRRATGMSPGSGCQMVVLVVDGIPVYDAPGTLAGMSLADVESMEYLSPLEAGFRYGLRASARGALVVWTRGRGPYRSPERDGGSG